ncbi:uncharacterized protein LOC134601790 [Pelobates fuscus]|uniref:uncharacterized protein LOC134601790 n=1 Tax=Pelobates fuscus TaxID=191477 RepID=UPI002FE4B27F
MDFSPAQLHLKDITESPEWNSQQQWGYPDSEGYCSLSPASSTDSSSFSPPYGFYAFPKEMSTSCNTVLPQTDMQSRTRNLAPKKSMKKRFMCGQRQNASEREKMRMRNLSTALQHVRRYLPPAVAPPGKNLTKIETLRLTIRYIAHLSEVLGLDEEALVRRREEAIRGSNMCPVGLSCCQGSMHAICPESRDMLPATATPSYLSYSPAPLQNHTGLGQIDRELKTAVPQAYECEAPAMTAAETMTFSPCALKGRPSHGTTYMDTKGGLTAPSPVSPDLGFCSNFIDDMWDDLPEKDLWTSFQPTGVQPQQFC